MIEEAAKAGATYVKWQLYNSDFINEEYPNYEVVKMNMKRCELTPLAVSNIMRKSQDMNVIPMFTIFNIDRLALLQGWPPTAMAVKIASPDLLNYSLVNAVRSKFKDSEMFISAGMHNEEEIENARYRYSDLKLKWLYCVSKYPAHKEDISYIDMRSFDGFSDHTEGIDCACLAIDINQPTYIEKHFTLSKLLPGKDQEISIDPEELKRLVVHSGYHINNYNYKRRFKEIGISS